MVDSYLQYRKVKEFLNLHRIENCDIYIPYTLIFEHEFSEDDIVYFDRVTHDSDLEKVDVEALKKRGFKRVLIRNLGQYQLLKGHFDLYFDYSFNVVNSFAVNFAKNLGAKRICLSCELSKKQLERIWERSSDDLEIEVIVFWRIPLMINKLKFFEKGSYLQDRKGEALKLISTQTLKNEILNPAILYIDDKAVPADVIRFDFTGFCADEITDVLENYFESKSVNFKFTKGYY